MPWHATPAEVAATAAVHGAAVHGEPFPETVIGRPHSHSSLVRVTWDEDAELGLFIRCRDCREGFDRFFVEVEREQPTERLLALTATHFARAHPEVDFTPEAVWHTGNRVENRVATFMPMLPQLGASIICDCCPQGASRVFLTPPPCGDARRLAVLLSDHPELLERTLDFGSREQAEYLEAWDRRLLQQRDRQRALERARAQARQPEHDPLKQALIAIMHERVAHGELITHVIKDLDRQSKEDPTGFACAVGMAISSLADFRGSATEAEFAQATSKLLGAVPTAAERTLWDLWTASADESPG
jgi:hypothetical protein